MNVLELAQAICLPKLSFDAVRGTEIPDELSTEMLTLLRNDFSAFEEQMNAEKDPNLTALSYFLHFGLLLQKEYRAEHIPDSVHIDCMRDIAIWCAECERRTGKPGTIDWKWLAMTACRRLYRIGRLEYEPATAPETLHWGELTVPAGTKYLNVHIPADGHLTKEIVFDSLHGAREFFNTFFGQDYTLMHCHSWLLGSELGSLLDEASGIRAFRSFFTRYDEEFSFAQAEERVFGCILPEPDAYPANTSLQKKLKQALLDGRHFGNGAGYLTL